jgi:hypothetical protein
MSYTLGQAARATGKAKPTIARAIQTGRISASRSEDGSWAIDPAELHRVYPMTGQTNGPMLRDLPGESAGTSLADLLAERDRLVAQQQETIRDLRARLDAEAEERRRVQAQLTGLLTDRRSDETILKPWWRRWFR